MKSKSLPSSTLRAFTLIELLTVIAIIGILAAILIPVVGSVRESARSSACISNLRQIGLTLFLYSDDHNETLPAPNGGNGLFWSLALNDYLGTTPGPRGEQRDHEIFICPSADYSNSSLMDAGRTYSFSAAGLGGNANGVLGSTVYGARKLSQISNHTTTILVVEGKERDDQGRALAGMNWNRITHDIGASSPQAAPNLDFRHNERMNNLYVDGSVRPMAFADLKKLDLATWRALPE
jgi:prepilin-type N-terminal cleavage/methylation domain-containing protein/prepilin-type processing-associated H-X9-DG protein